MAKTDIFLRKATGLVRAWSITDAFIYALFSINLITLGLYIISQMYYLEGGLIPTLLISGAIIMAEVVVYAGLIAVMPRAGGDYIWQSRILGGAIGFVLAVTGWWFILWLWVPLYADMLRHIFFVPLLALAGAQGGALWFVETDGALFLVSVILIAFVSVVITMGMRWYAAVQKFCFYMGMAGLVIVFLFLLFGSNAGFRSGLESQWPALYGTEGAGLYEATLAAGAEAGAVLPLVGSGLGLVFLAMPYIVFFNLWPNWGATLYGEVRGATDFKRNFYGMGGALAVTTVLAVIFFLLIQKTISWEFYVNANGAYWNYRWGFTDVVPPLGPVWPYPVLLALLLTGSRAIQFIVVLAMSMWFFGWAGTVFLSSTRVIFAAAFDRLLPEKVAEVEPRTRTPVWALVMMAVPSLIVAALYSWNIANFQSLTLTATLVIAITFLGSTVAATIMPWTHKDLYEASPIAHYRVAGIPLISIAGVIFGLFLLFLIYQWLIDPNELYGISYRNTSAVFFTGFLYLMAFLIYFGFKSYRQREGLDIEKVYQVIPVE
jgi:basic amino acid/polyamine antiporter, APA family